MALAGVKEKYYKAGDLDDFQEALREGSKEKEYTTPEDMVEDYSEKDTDKGTNSHKSDDSGFMSKEDEFDFENEEDDWAKDYSDEEEIYEEDTEDTDDSFGVAEETDEEDDEWGCGEADKDDWDCEDTSSTFESEEANGFDGGFGSLGDDFNYSEKSDILSEEANGFDDWGDEEYGWRRRFKDLNTSNKENTDRICTTLKECFTELAIVGIIMTMFALLITIVMKDDK